MRAEVPRAILEVHYEAAAEEYLRKLKPENHMEATPQATQREITLASLALVHERRPDVQFFNELLVQYPVGNRRKPGQVVPDNMIVVHPTPLRVPGHYSLALQPARPFWVMEYVSNSSRRKDYVKSMEKYETELKVPYYLVFYPDAQELSLFRLEGTKYLSVIPDEAGLHAVPELEMAVSLVDGWARYWFRGEMLPLSGQLLRDLDQAKRDTARANQETARQRLRADEAERDREEAERQRGEAIRQREDAERRSEAAENARLAMADQFARLQTAFQAMQDAANKTP